MKRNRVRSEPWSEEELDILCKYYLTSTMLELKILLPKRTTRSIICMVSKLRKEYKIVGKKSKDSLNRHRGY